MREWSSKAAALRPSDDGRIGKEVDGGLSTTGVGNVRHAAGEIGGGRKQSARTSPCSLTFHVTGMTLVHRREPGSRFGVKWSFGVAKWALLAQAGEECFAISAAKPENPAVVQVDFVVALERVQLLLVATTGGTAAACSAGPSTAS